MLAGFELSSITGLSRALGCRLAWRRAKRLGTATTGSLIGAATVLIRFHGLRPGLDTKCSDHFEQPGDSGLSAFVSREVAQMLHPASRWSITFSALASLIVGIKQGCMASFGELFTTLATA